jgi:hypothetical protein
MKTSKNGAWAAAVWTCLFLLLLDVSMNLVQRYGASGQGAVLSMSRYLDYGRSIEGKLHRAVLPENAHASGKVVSAGWLDPALWTDLPRSSTAGSPLVAVYGQSFTFRTMTLASQTMPVSLRKIGGPAAPVTHSLEAYRLDTQRDRADWVVVGVLASSMGKVNAMSGLGGSFESPAPYTYPALTRRAEAWEARMPALPNELSFREALSTGGPTWQAFRQQVLEANPALDAFAFDQSWSDHSALMRLIRRGWVTSLQSEHHVPRLSSELLGANLEALRRLGTLARERNERLLVIVFRDRGALDINVAPILAELRRLEIPTIDSQVDVDANDPRVFESDGHFKADAERRVAARVVNLMMAGR